MTERDAAVVERDTARAQVEQQAQLIAARERTISRRDAQIAALTAEIARLRRVQFAAKSERMNPAQRELFEETLAADIAAVEAQLAAVQAEGKDASAPRQQRKATGAGRKPLPEHLERVESKRTALHYIWR